jgi:hypothetical protein
MNFRRDVQTGRDPSRQVRPELLNWNAEKETDLQFRSRLGKFAGKRSAESRAAKGKKNPT